MNECGFKIWIPRLVRALDPVYSEKMPGRQARAERGLVFTVNAQNAKRCTKHGRAFGTPLGPRSARLFLTVNASRAKWGTKFGTPFGIYTKRLLCMNAHSLYASFGQQTMEAIMTSTMSHCWVRTFCAWVRKRCAKYHQLYNFCFCLYMFHKYFTMFICIYIVYTFLFQLEFIHNL